MVVIDWKTLVRGKQMVWKTLVGGKQWFGTDCINILYQLKINILNVADQEKPNLFLVKTNVKQTYQNPEEKMGINEEMEISLSIS